jgi:hypothetical protein
MTDADALSLATDWIAHWEAPEGSVEKDELAWTADKEWELVREAPHDAWKLVLAVVQLAPPQPVLAALSAGPVEDLLTYHGDKMIDTVEAEARRDPRFAHVLGGVWQNSLSDTVWARVQAVWNRQGWDDPAA